MIYQEVFLAMQRDPFSTLIFLHDTGLDILFFNRHLTREELLKILSSEHLNFLIDEEKGKVYKTRNEKIRSRRSRLIKARQGANKSGMLGIFAAIGEEFAPEELKKDFDSHLTIGLNIFANPEKNKPKLKIPKLDDSLKISEDGKTILNTLIENGSMTERRLQTVLTKIDSIKWTRHHLEDELTSLKIGDNVGSSLRVIIDGRKKIKARFYEPRVSTTRIDEILYENKKIDSLIIKAYESVGVNSLETALIMTSKELNKSGKWGKTISFLYPLILNYLAEQYRQREERPNTHSNI